MPTMSTITFDTLEGAAKLRAAGFDEKQAEAVVRVLADAQSSLVTREHFDAKFAVVEAKMDKLSWMVGVVIALALANFAKQFF
jgi:arginine repressor